MTSLSHRFRRMILVLFHLMLLVTPFFFTWINEELFEFPKMLLTYGFTILISAFWLGRMILEKKLLIQKTVFDWPLIIFLLSQVAATIFSIHFHTSIFGYYTRFHGGLLSTLTYLVLFYAFVSNVKKEELSSFWLTIFVAVLGVSLYGILEHFGRSLSCSLITGQFDVACWVQDVKNRVFASFGQPNWLAAYLITLLPLNLVLSQQTKKVWLKILFIITTFSSLIALIYTRSRSGLAGFFLGFFILVLGWLWLEWRSTQHAKKTKGGKLFFLVAGALLTIVAFNGTALTPSLKQVFIKQNPNTADATDSTAVIANKPNPQPTAPAVNRLQTGGTDSGEIRKIVWTGALKVWQRYPVFGSGVGTFAYSYYQDRPVAHNLVSEWDFLYNKAHNEFLNFLATTGLVGLLSYLGLLATFAWVSLRPILSLSQQQKLQLQEKQQLLALLSGVAALSVSNFFGFSTVMVSILLFLFLGMVVIIVEQPQIKVKETQDKLDFKQSLALTLVAILSLFLLGRVRRIFVADKAFASGQSYLQAGYAQQGLEKLQTAVQLRPQEALFHDKLANAYSKLAIVFDQQAATPSATRFKEAALQEAQLTQDLNPRHLNFYKSHARILILLSQLEPSLLNKAQEILQTGIELAPTDAKLVYNLGLIQLEQGQTEAGVKTLEKALKLKPNYLKVKEKLEELK